nr:MAG TPA: hypothetical protein [Bacteriophage sp.]
MGLFWRYKTNAIIIRVLNLEIEANITRNITRSLFLP